jgi:DNA repair exonuclease SbcCD ATPase subunit
MNKGTETNISNLKRKISQIEEDYVDVKTVLELKQDIENHIKKIYAQIDSDKKDISKKSQGISKKEFDEIKEKLQALKDKLDDTIDSETLIEFKRNIEYALSQINPTNYDDKLKIIEEKLDEIGKSFVNEDLIYELKKNIEQEIKELYTKLNPEEDISRIQKDIKTELGKINKDIESIQDQISKVNDVDETVKDIKKLEKKFGDIKYLITYLETHKKAIDDIKDLKKEIKDISEYKDLTEFLKDVTESLSNQIDSKPNNEELEEIQSQIMSLDIPDPEEIYSLKREVESKAESIQIEEIEQKIADLKIPDLEEIKEIRSLLQEKADSKELQKIDLIASEIENINAKIESLKESINARIESLKESQSEDFDSIEKQLQEKISEKFEETSQELQKLRLKSENLEQEIKDVDDDAASYEELEGLQTEITAIKKQLTYIGEIDKRLKEIIKSEKHLEKQQDLEEDIRRLRKELKELDIEVFKSRKEMAERDVAFDRIRDVERRIDTLEGEDYQILRADLHEYRESLKHVYLKIEEEKRDVMRYMKGIYEELIDHKKLVKDKTLFEQRIEQYKEDKLEKIRNVLLSGFAGVLLFVVMLYFYRRINPTSFPGLTEKMVFILIIMAMGLLAFYNYNRFQPIAERWFFTAQEKSIEKKQKPKDAFDIKKKEDPIHKKAIQKGKDIISKGKKSISDEKLGKSKIKGKDKSWFDKLVDYLSDE